jgi:hypothetical protein
MLEETRLDYALATVFVEVWISIGSCRRLLLDDVSALSEARFQEKSVHERGAPARVR